MKNKPLVVWASDMHLNDLSSICPPVLKRDSGHEHRSSKDVNELWRCWLDAWEVIRLRRRQVIVVFGGEFADTDMKDRSNHLITRNIADIKAGVMDMIEPALKVAHAVIVLRGTEAHSGREGDFDATIANDITKTVISDPDTGEKARWYARETIGGKRFDLAHHANMGGARRTEKDAANHIAFDLKQDYAEWGERLPDWALRGHVHRVSDSGINYLPMRVLTAPCWSLNTSPFIHRIGGGQRRPQIGLLVIDTGLNEPERINYEVNRPPFHINDF